MPSARSSRLERTLAIRDPARRLAALRALLPQLAGAERKAAAAAIRALEAELGRGPQTVMRGRPPVQRAEVIDMPRPGGPGGAPREIDLGAEAADLSAEHAPPVVSLGFCEPARAEAPISATHTLVVDQPYYLWLEIGAPVSGAVNERTLLPIELLPTEVELDVVVFATADGGFVVPRDGGRIRITPGGCRVTRMQARPAVGAALLRQRLFFAVTAPARPGTYPLACHLYYQGALVQSHELVATVTAHSEARAAPAVTARMDYVLSRRLAPSSLAGYAEHALSIAVGVADDGSHRFAFSSTAGDGFARDASFDDHEVQDLIGHARRALRTVSWGSEDAWTPGMPYRYDGARGITQLTEDLARLAIAGYRNYDTMVDRLGGDREPLAARMRRPGTIQLALKHSARLVLPLALIYDHRLDTDGDPASYALCEQFSRSTAALDRHPCFLGDCPERDAGGRVVCPSGFWGFRHEIGIPPTLHASDGSSAQLPALLVCPDVPAVAAAVSMDPGMVERDGHLRQLEAMIAPGRFRVARTRDQALDLLRAGGAHIVYFYCHGGCDQRAPYLQIGAPHERISRASLRAARIEWSDPRALVFINGCHTTDLEPERAIDLVSGFIQTARGAGVIGTEITVFEPLATRFAELCIAALLARQTVGAAIRHARLALLEDWNPLGLLYVPFAMASLRLAPATA